MNCLYIFLFFFFSCPAPFHPLLVHSKQVRDLDQRLSKATDGRTVAEGRCQALEKLEQALEADLEATKASLEARQTELVERKDKASSWL